LTSRWRFETLGSKRHAHYLKREDLHKLVWAAPVSEVASRVGISDVGLAKAGQARIFHCLAEAAGQRSKRVNMWIRAAAASASRRARVDPKNWDFSVCEISLRRWSPGV
jgi:hypothetical protein